jgi:hypothetical protein
VKTASGMMRQTKFNSFLYPFVKTKPAFTPPINTYTPDGWGVKFGLHAQSFSPVFCPKPKIKNEAKALIHRYQSHKG